MVVTIHQPDFLPWLGFFDRWKRSDLFIVLDDVQFIRRGWQHRDKIKTARGVQWLTVPVMKKSRFSQKISDVEIDNQADWRQKHLNTLSAAYRKALHFERVYGALNAIYSKRHLLLIDLNLDLLTFGAEALGVATPLVLSSSLHERTTKSERLANLVKAVGGTIYLTGLGSKGYLDDQPFKRQGVEVIWQRFQHPVYPQLHGAFEPMLSVLDYLMSGAPNLTGLERAA
jgi:hypothetical protein